MKESLVFMGSGASREPLPNFFGRRFPPSTDAQSKARLEVSALLVGARTGARMAFADLGSLQIHYELRGADDLPVLVLSNSLGANLAMWEPQLEALAPHLRLLRYDMRGHGQSSIPKGPYSIADLGSDVLGLLDTLGIEKASFCGISLGGVTGQWLAVNAPHRLQKLVLANTAAKIGSAAGWDARIAAVLQDGLQPIVPGTLERWFTADFRTAYPNAVAGIRGVLEATSAQGYAACCAAIRDADFRVGVATVVTPTLVIAGIHDPVTTISDATFLSESIAGSQSIELDAAHLSNIEAAGAFNQALLKFLTA